jgi:hypothetical protein
MVFVVPNPDYKSKANDTISVDDARKRFEKCFKPEKLSCYALTDKQRSVELAAVENVLNRMDTSNGGKGVLKKGGGRFKTRTGDEENGPA